MSSTLAYNISLTEFRRDVAESVKRVYGLDIGPGYVYNVFASFKTKTDWTNPIIMIYDTGAVVSLLRRVVLEHRFGLASFLISLGKRVREV